MTDLLEFCKQVGLEPKRVASTHGGEYKSPCPECFGTDRFTVWPNRQYKSCVGGYFCRHCNKGGDSIQFCRVFLGMTWDQAVAATRATVQLDWKHQRLTHPKPPQFKATIAPSGVWQKRVEELVCWASNQIKNKADVLGELESRGLPLEVVEKFRIGYVDNPNNHYGAVYIPPSQLGLKEEVGKDGRQKKVWIPRGILIPSIEPSGKIVRLKVRRSDYSPGDDIPKYAAVPGSAGGLNLIGSRARDAVVVVESEFDGYAVCHAVGDVALVVAIGSNIKTPDSFTDFLSKESKILLICHDNDEGGRVMKDRWMQMYSHARAYPTPFHKDVGEAIKDGVNIRDWLLAALKEKIE